MRSKRADAPRRARELVTDRPYRGQIDYERLGAYLRVLGVPTRVLLLHKLQVPRAAGEIQLPAFRRARDHRDDRPISRGGVEKHLAALEEAGLVRSRATTREGKPAREYVVNPARLFVIVDELRRLSLLRPPPTAVSEWTAPADGTVPRPGAEGGAALPDGPALVLASGPSEGTPLPLEGEGPWTVGRGASCEIVIPHDPFVSQANCVLRAEGRRFFLRDLPTATNGTTLNWRLLPRGAEAPLVPGDTVGVGRSLLVFRRP